MNSRNSTSNLKYLSKITALWVVVLAVIWWLCWKTLSIEKVPWWITISDYVGIISGMLTGTFVIVTGLFMFFGHDELLRLLRRFSINIGKTEFINTGDAFKSDDVKAIVIPVSRYQQPAWIINHLTPEKVALICTDASSETGVDLIKEFGESLFINSLGALQNRETWSLLQNPEDPSESRKMTRRFVREFLKSGYLPSEIYVDTTGGMVPMSIGCFQGAEEEGLSSIYINGTVPDKNSMIIKDPAILNHGRPVYINDRSRTTAATQVQ